jgi:DNA-binding winged helix-turn-helix (wHTH) protein/TolB-like protein/thioredoxin-like negative regulator of GroEL
MPNGRKTECLYEFGPYRLDVVERLLMRDSEVIPLKAKAFDMLLLLVENAGHLLEKEWLLQELWPDSFVEEVNLNVNISALRKALGESATSPTYIETIPKRGYRFIAHVTQIGSEDTSSLSRKRDAEKNNNSTEGATTTSASLKSTYATTPPGTGSHLADISKATTRDDTPVSGGTYSRTHAGWKAPAIAVALLLTIAFGAYSLWRSKTSNKITSLESIQTIAVLPFKTATGNDADIALGLGMADALITRLGNTHRITVRPTSAVLKYSGNDRDPLEDGKALGVEAVLTGFVQKDGKAIRVSTQMIRVSDGATLWSNQFDDFFTNVFAVQDSISERMAEALSMRLTPAEQNQMTRRYTENADAYQLYSQARYFHFKYQYEKALEFYRAALAKDPDYPLAYAGLAANYVALAVTTPNRQEMRDKAMAAANLALNLDPNLDDAHNALGWIKFLADWDWGGAEQELRRAIELNPNNADARQNYATLLDVLARHDEALAVIEQARKLDPVSGEIIRSQSMILYHAHRFDQALEHSRRAIASDPDDPQADSLLPRIYVAKGQYEQVIAELGKRTGPEGIVWRLYAACAYNHLGRTREAEKILQTFLERAGRPGASHSIALVYACLGDRAHALEWLEKAYQARDNQMIHLKVDPIWDDLRSEARFVELLRRMRLTQ